jgi:hypothetical protein
MPFCPECGAEYVAGIKTCTECGVELVADAPKESVDEDWVPVAETSQEYEAEMIRQRLGEEGIAARVISKADHAIGIVIGDLAVVSVYVHRDDLEDARELLRSGESPDLDSLEDIPGDSGLE